MTPQPRRTQALALLGLPADASRPDVVAAFRRLARLTHPDATGDTGGGADFAAVRDAYRLLADSTPPGVPTRPPSTPVRFPPPPAAFASGAQHRRQRPAIVPGPVYVAPLTPQRPAVRPQGDRP